MEEKLLLILLHNEAKEAQTTLENKFINLRAGFMSFPSAIVRDVVYSTEN